MSDFIDEELLKEWFEEAYELIDKIEESLLVLESNTSDSEAIDSLFRAAHTLKGGSATVQFLEISHFTHTMEDAMDEIRNGAVKVSSGIVDVLLRALDIIKEMVAARAQSNVYSENFDETLNELKKIAEHSVDETPQKKTSTQNIVEKEEVVVEKKEETANGDEIFEFGEYDLMEIKQGNTENLPMWQITVDFNEDNPMRTVGGIQVFTSLRDAGTVLKTVPDFDSLYSDEFYQSVIYIVATSESKERLQEMIELPDMTKEINILPFSIDNIDSAEQEVPAVETQVTPQKVDIKDVLSMYIENTEEEPVSAVAEVAKDVKRNQDEVKKKTSASAIKDTKNVASSVLRVDSSRIDELLNLVSEIVINKATFNQLAIKYYESIETFSTMMNVFKDKNKHFSGLLAHNTGSNNIESLKNEYQKDIAAFTTQFDSFLNGYKEIVEKFRSTSQSLDRISSDLREGVMRVRMIQIKQVFSRFPRLVRDLSRDLHKEIDLVMEGEETEVDKAMLDDLSDPLIHMIRNAVDHGMETPEERLAAGKSVPGMVKLKAANEGNLISIYISDDGRGINPESVRKRAIERKIISADKQLSEQDTFALLFEPGFSTADKITSVSGRGVGLDVVKKNIEKMSGTVRITSVPGKGTTFIIKLPLTLAIIQGLMVRVQSEIYVLPISSVIESIRISPQEIKSIDNYEVINVRNEVLSLLRLSRLFNLKKSEDLESYFVVIVGINDKKMGLLVDSLIGEEDIVIKPLKDKYTSTPGIAGATVLGDGTVSLILDVSQIVELGMKQEQENQQNRKNNNRKD
ncbi:MAG: chemotaxis protein CheA [Spirochaetota bacterium]|nr:chemotaxis protein CheA [Spirochaetota bacterium]